MTISHPKAFDTIRHCRSCDKGIFQIISNATFYSVIINLKLSGIKKKNIRYKKIFFKSDEMDWPYRGFGYLRLFSDPIHVYDMEPKRITVI